MKEIKNKIKDSIFGEFNQELIGDKVKLQNKVNKLQRMIDMINYLQPIEEKEDFVLPENWCVLITEDNKNTFQQYMIQNKNKYNGYTDEWEVLAGFYFVNPLNSDFNSTRLNESYSEITFEQFKKYVLNK